MTKAITAPYPLPMESFYYPSLFLAGGITGCGDWQAEVINRLYDLPITMLNPRRADFPMDDPSAAQEQIKWEHDALRLADRILFWFAAEQIQPIALYELGAWSMTSKPMIVGAHPNYPRRTDVVYQTKFARPEIHVTTSLDAVIERVKQGAFNG